MDLVISSFTSLLMRSLWECDWGFTACLSFFLFLFFLDLLVTVAMLKPDRTFSFETGCGEYSPPSKRCEPSPVDSEQKASVLRWVDQQPIRAMAQITYIPKINTALVMPASGWEKFEYTTVTGSRIYCVLDVCLPCQTDKQSRFICSHWSHFDQEHHALNRLMCLFIPPTSTLQHYTAHGFYVWPCFCFLHELLLNCVDKLVTVFKFVFQK